MEMAHGKIVKVCIWESRMRMLLFKPWVAGFSGLHMGGEAGSDLTTQLF